MYALRECFFGTHAIEPTPANVYGVLSLIVWSLLLVISVKYLLIVMRAANNGEGGILALTALVTAGASKSGSDRFNYALLIGLFGAALLYGDGIITPAISVLSAVEGLNVATPVLQPYVVPLTIVILTALFLCQTIGTQGIGAVFGPVMLAWFLVLAGTGLAQVLGNPAVLGAINPIHAIRLGATNGGTTFFVMGVVFLAVTGGEALYADMGHFGKLPIRVAWFGVALPALLLNYFGQGALILGDVRHAANPFYHLVSEFWLYPLVLLATLATVIASQAVITGAFSLTSQAVQLGYLPRLNIRHTSEIEYGQIYVPVVNALLLVLTLAVVVGFGSSGRLASAYGVAVSTTMLITTMLVYFCMRDLWHWHRAMAVLVTLLLLVIDFSFFLANIAKFSDGGWFPLLIAALVMTMMTTWRHGRELLLRRLSEASAGYDEFFAQLDADPPVRVGGAQVYLASTPDIVPPALVQNVKHNRVLHRQVAVVTVVFERQPFVRSEDRVTFDMSRPDFFRICVRYGFRQRPNVPRALAVHKLSRLKLDPETTTYVLGREALLASHRHDRMAVWREMLFSFMARNARRAADYFQIPSKQVLEIGVAIEL